ncbi:hypothetical protein FGO68_gene5233 [Halteria grandinella]|uniref:Uncharacterized protein n=1 Tax=Halteria grandinella TaxID=5974 RepID=A0A8J8NQR3_HALGN|nr:hypothetical protein FGO68_gene5233 [Halteria grandinella]
MVGEPICTLLDRRQQAPQVKPLSPQYAFIQCRVYLTILVYSLNIGIKCSLQQQIGMSGVQSVHLQNKEIGHNTELVFWKVIQNGRIPNTLSNPNEFCLCCQKETLLQWFRMRSDTVDSVLLELK